MSVNMKRKLTCLLLPLAIAACKKKDNPTPSHQFPPNDQHVWVTTQHNDNTRAGLNANEQALTVSNVNEEQFGKLFSLPVDDEVYAQPLVAGNLDVKGAKHNVVYIATVANTVYAFDADNGSLLWQKNYTLPALAPVSNTDMTGACGGNYNNFTRHMGIVGTPVIDSAAHVMYFVARSTNHTAYYQYLHAINLADGSEVNGSPVEIKATYKGNGDGSVGGILTFDPQKQNQRQALTLVNGVVYISFSSHCDWGPYHGWILGYNAKTLQQEIVYNDTPEGINGGIWESGMGMAADAEGNLYAVTGNGTVGSNGNESDVINRGESALKLVPSAGKLIVSSFFTPYNYQDLENNDLDYGTMGSLLIPGTPYFVTGCKDGNIYLVNKDNMGGCSRSSNNNHQTVFTNASANMHCQAACYKSNSAAYVYVWSENDVLRQYPFVNNMLDVSNYKTSALAGPTGQSGAVLSVSCNGAKDGTAILWASYPKSGDAESVTSPGILRAFDATDVSKELWNNRSENYNYAKFSSPTIANGHVYLPTFSKLVIVYGLK